MVNCTLGCLKLSPMMLLVYFCLLNILMYMDRGVLSSLVPALQDDKDVHLSDFQAGVLGSVFMFGFMIASPIFAYSSQTIHPFTLIAIGISVWGGSVLFASVSHTFWSLVAARTLSGIGEASFVCLASPIILAIAPSAKKNLWISFFYMALTLGYALGYVLAPPIKNAFDGWSYVFLFEAIASVPFIAISIFAYRDPSLIFKKDVKVPIMEQFKELSNNKVYIFLVLGNGAWSFTVGGIAFWGPTILQKQFEKGETAATFSLGAITIVSGLIATVTGSLYLEKMIRPYRFKTEKGEISNDKFDYYRTEKAAKFILATVSVAFACVSIGAVLSPAFGKPVYVWPFIFFLFFIALGEFFLFLGTGPSNIGVMTSVSEELRPQGVAVSIFFMHLLGDFPSPFLIGLVNESLGMYWGTCLTMFWLIFTIAFWFIAFNIAVITTQRFHGAPSDFVWKNFCNRNSFDTIDERRLITAGKEDTVESKDAYPQDFHERSVNKSITREMD